MSPLPVSLTFSRLGPGDSNIFQCEPHWPNGNNGCHDEHTTSGPYSHLYFQLLKAHAGRARQKQHASDTVIPAVRQHLMPCLTRFDNKPCNEPLIPTLSLDGHAQDSETEKHADISHSGRFSSPSSRASSAAQWLLQHKAARLLPPIDFVPQVYHGVKPTNEAPVCPSREVSNSSKKSDGPIEPYLRSKKPELAASPDLVKPDPPDPIHHQQSLGSNDAPPKPRSLHKISASGELRRDAGWPLADTQLHIEPVEECDSQSRTSSLELNAAYNCEQPSTPASSKSRLWIEPSSSEESVEQAVTQPGSAYKGHTNTNSAFDNSHFPHETSSNHHLASHTLVDEGLVATSYSTCFLPGACLSFQP